MVCRFFYGRSLTRPHFFPLDSFLPEVPAHGAVDDEVEAGVEGDEQGGDAGGGNSIESQPLNSFSTMFLPAVAGLHVTIV